MKFLFPAIAVFLFAGCNSNMVRHQKDFSPPKKQGAWNDYRKSTWKGEQYEGPKELKDR